MHLIWSGVFIWLCTDFGQASCTGFGAVFLFAGAGMGKIWVGVGYGLGDFGGLRGVWGHGAAWHFLTIQDV